MYNLHLYGSYGHFTNEGKNQRCLRTYANIVKHFWNLSIKLEMIEEQKIFFLGFSDKINFIFTNYYYIF